MVKITQIRTSNILKDIKHKLRKFIRMKALNFIMKEEIRMPEIIVTLLIVHIALC